MTHLLVRHILDCAIGRRHDAGADEDADATRITDNVQCVLMKWCGFRFGFCFYR